MIRARVNDLCLTHSEVRLSNKSINQYRDNYDFLEKKHRLNHYGDQTKLWASLLFVEDLFQEYLITGTVLLKDLRTHLKLEYHTKSLNYIQQNFRLQAWFLFY